MKWFLLAAIFAPAFVGWNVATAHPAIRVIASEEKTTIQDTVKKIREDDEGMMVLFVKAQGSYYLRRSAPEFDSSYKKLQDSLKLKKPVSVTAEQGSLNIVEVK